MSTSRRKFIKDTALFTAAGLVGFPVLKSFATNEAAKEFSADLTAEGDYTLPPLPYAYDALEPAIDKATMEIHHTKHHQAYVNNLNKALKERKDGKQSLEEILKNVSKYPEAVRNNGGGHWNHSFFWKIMKAGGGGKPEGKLADAINSAFSSFEEFQNKFNEAAKTRFGSGWAWLVADKNGKLQIGSTPNQDNPLMNSSELKGKPLLGLDVWEHAYYLKYQNKRPDYISAWWGVVNWEEVMKNYV